MTKGSKVTMAGKKTGNKKSSGDKSIPKSNHPEWVDKYVNNANFVNLNFGYRKSLDQNLNYYMNITNTAAQAGGLDNSVIAIAQIHLLMPNDTLNTLLQAVTIMWNKIRSANSGSINFTVQDLLVYILNVRSIRAALVQLSRAIKSTNVVDPYDSDLPEVLSTICGAGTRSVDGNTYRGTHFSAILNDKANITNQLNSLIRSVRTMLPLNIDLFKRSEWLLGNIFKDSDSAKFSYIVPVCYRIPKYYIEAEGDNTYIKRTVGVNFATITDGYGGDAIYDQLRQLSTFITEMISASVNIGIAGDILKAFGDSAFYNQGDIAVTDTPSIVYDHTFLKQFQNATVPGMSEFSDDDAVSEVMNAYTGNIVTTFLHDSTWTSVLKYDVAKQCRIINSYDNSTSPGEVLSMTQNAVFFSSDVDNKFTVTHCGNAIIGNVLYAISAITNSVGNRWPIVIRLSDTELNSYENNAKIINAWSLVDYSPFVSVPLGSSSAGVFYAYMFDSENFAQLTREQFDSFNQLATLSYLETNSHIKRQNEFTFLTNKKN